jgi:N-acyl-D-amino-acid deacylase
MAAEIEDSLARGCLGVSFGLRYVPGMDTGELLETAAPLQKYRGLLAAHIRDDAAAVFGALREFLDAALQLDTPVQVSHIGSMAGFGQMADFLSLLDSYRLRRPDIACDCYPYDVFCTSIGSATFDDGWLYRYNCGYDAVELCEGKYKGQRCTKEIFEEVRREHPEYLVVCYVMQQSEVDLAFTHPAVMVGSDGTLDDGQGHPRAAGAFPRLLSRYVKSKTITLYDAVSRMTSLPAAQLGLAKKGGLRPGMDADVVIFDPETIEDRSTFAQPLTPPQGIDWVIVGGTPAVEHGRVTHLHAGHSVRAERGV